MRCGADRRDLPVKDEVRVDLHLDRLEDHVVVLRVRILDVGAVRGHQELEARLLHLPGLLEQHDEVDLLETEKRADGEVD